MDQLLVSVEEAALALGIGKTLAYELAASGELPTVRLGTRRLVPTAALREWVDRMALASRLATPSPESAETPAIPARTSELRNRLTAQEGREAPRAARSHSSRLAR